MAKIPATHTTPPERVSEANPGADAAASSAAPAPGQSIALPNPGAGGSYTRDPATGELTCTVPATQPPPAMRKTQDPVTGAITRTAL